MNNLELSEETTIAPVEVFLDGTSITEVDLDETCRNIVTRLIETGDTTEIEQAITNLNGVEKFAAKAKSKLIFAWSEWYQARYDLNDFPKWFVQKFGGEELTVQKHQAIGELLMSEDVPEEVKLLNSKELVSVARAKQSGYDLNEHWEEIVHAGSEAEVNNVIRKVKGKEPRNGTLSLSLQPDGSITAWMGEVMVSAGWLNLQDRDDENTPDDKRKVLDTAIARITNNSRMRVK